MGGVKSCFRPSSKGEITFPQNGVKEKRDEDGREVTDGEGEGGGGGGGGGGGTNFSEDENTERGNWSGRLDFILACLGYAVGLGNIWRFPYLCYRNGGALFLIPYAIMMLFVGVPIFFLELALGQFTSSSPITCWEMACIFRGIGVGMLIVSAMVGIYYNIIIAWAVHFLFSSFTSDVPWQYCHNWWNTEWCAKNLVDNINKTYCDEELGLNAKDDGVCYNGTRPYAIWNETIAESNNLRKILPAQEYFNTRLLRKTFSTGLDDLGPVNWELALCLLFVWSLCALILCKGIKSSGKVVYFTCIFPYVVLLILLVRGATLPGAYQGIKFFFLEVDISKLGNAAVWKDAATQVFFSLSASWGGLIALSSYNRFQNNFLKDTLIAAFGDMATSIFAGFVIFSFIGFIAHDLNTTIDKVVQQGTGLAFIVYPDAVTRMPLPTLWAILFFLMVATIGLDSELPLIETVCTCVMDLFPSFRKRKWLLSLICCIVGYLLALPLVTDGGIFVFELMDNYCGSWNVLIIALCECICIAYVYGFCRYREDIRLMIGNKPLCCIPWNVISIWWAACWYVISPGLLLFILVFSWIQYEPLTVGNYVYPSWGEGIGWFLTVIVVAGVVFGAISQIGWCLYKKYPLITLFRPNKNWGPALPKHRKLMAAYLREVPSGQFRVGHREFEVNPKGGRLPPDSKLELRKIKLTAGEVNNGFDSLDSPPHHVFANGDGVYHEKY